MSNRHVCFCLVLHIFINRFIYHVLFVPSMYLLNSCPLVCVFCFSFHFFLCVIMEYVNSTGLGWVRLDWVELGLVLRWDPVIFPRLTLNSQSSSLSLWSNWDYRHEPECLALNSTVNTYFISFQLLAVINVTSDILVHVRAVYTLFILVVFML